MYVQVIDLKRELDMTEQQLKAVQRKYNQLQREHSETTKTLTLSKLYLLPLYVLTPFVNPIHMYIYIIAVMTKPHLSRTGTAALRPASPDLNRDSSGSPISKPGSPNRWVVNNAMAKASPRRYIECMYCIVVTYHTYILFGVVT